MNSLQNRIYKFATACPDKVAIEGAEVSLDYQSLVNAIEQVTRDFGWTESASQSYAILMDNEPAWAILDLALLFSHHCAVPLPKFFSIAQLKHALMDSQAQYLLVEKSAMAEQLLSEVQDRIVSEHTFEICLSSFTCYRLKPTAKVSNQLDLASAVKITYTSGTTSKPKGVVLSEHAIVSKVAALAEATGCSHKDVALSLLPLSTLLENIGGLYVPLYCGASATILPPELTGISGSSQVNPEPLLAAIHKYQPSVFIIIPQLLQLLIHAVQNGYDLPDSLRFIAMGGAPVSKQLLETARALNIPVFEGYGLSEAASVVSVNNPGNNRLGSVGKVLNIHDLQINDDGEILVKGHLFNGYLGSLAQDPGHYYATGDLGHLDKDGYLFISGRRKNIINTSYGRNISPEWVEKELDACPFIGQCLVYGHGKPYLIVIIVPISSSRLGNMPEGDIQANIKTFISHVNDTLPDYARVLDIVFTDEAFTIANNQLTGTGRPKRPEIEKAYENKIQQCYENSLLSQSVSGESI